MGRSNAQFYNVLSLIFLGLTAIVLIVVIVVASGDAPEDAPIELGELPVRQELPTVTPSFTATVTPIPSATFTATNTPTPTNTPSETASLAPTPTITDTPGPSLTPSNTPTASVSPTPQPTATPSAPTPTPTTTTSPFFFNVSGDIFLGPNTVNSAGCNWQGIGGSVINIDGSEATTQYQIRVFGAGIDRTILTGTNSFYGATSGWEVVIGNTITPQTYIVRIESAVGTPLSEDVQVTYPGDCNANLAIVRFQQFQPLPGQTQSQTAPSGDTGSGPPGDTGSGPPGS